MHLDHCVDVGGEKASKNCLSDNFLRIKGLCLYCYMMILSSAVYYLRDILRNHVEVEKNLILPFFFFLQMLK